MSNSVIKVDFGKTKSIRTPGARPESSQSRRPQQIDADLAERIERIKNSILRINQLMAELRSMNAKKDD